MLKKLVLILCLASCAPNTLEVPASPLPSASSTPIPAPSNPPKTNPTPTPLPTPNVVPTPLMPIPTPTVPIPTPIPAFSAKPLAIPAYAGECTSEPGADTGILEHTFITGKVVDEENKGVMGAHIRVKSLVPCPAYGMEVTTNGDGEYTVSMIPPHIPIELEVSAPSQPSAFYQTRLKSNKQGDPHTNYFPFRIQKPLPISCIALAPSRVDVSGKVSFNPTKIPSGSEALIHLKSLDGCSSFDAMVPTADQAYNLNVWSLGAMGQLTVSFAGQPTAVFEVPINSNKQQLPDVNVHNLSVSASEDWPELEPVWTPGKAYPLGSRSFK